MILFKQKKIEDISVKDICEVSGFSRTTFYRYFRDKNDLISFLFDELVTKEIFNKENKKDFYRQTLIPLEIIRENRSFMKKLLSYQGQNSFREYYLSGIEDYFREFYKDRYNAEISWAEEYTITFNSHGIVSIVESWLERDCLESPKEITDIIVKSLSSSIQEMLFKER